MTKMSDMERNERDEMAYAVTGDLDTPMPINLGVDNGPDGQEVSLTIEQATHLMLQLATAIAEAKAAERN